MAKFKSPTERRTARVRRAVKAAATGVRAFGVPFARSISTRR